MTDDLTRAATRIAEALERLSPAPFEAPDFDAADAFVWHTEPDHLAPVAKVNRVPLDLLIGVNRARDTRDTLLENTVQFARGLPANNALLWGARGMGKSSLVKAIHAEVQARDLPLKMVELQREDLPTVARLLNLLRASDHRFVLFCDDLSFSHDDQHYKSLKAVLDGGIEGRPENVVFYATSNRRHLMPRDMIENERSSAINPSEAVEEKVSLSDRFGLWLGFHPCDQDEYLAMIDGYCAAYGRHPARRGDRVAGDTRGALGPGGLAVLPGPRRAPRSGNPPLSRARALAHTAQLFLNWCDTGLPLRPALCSGRGRESAMELRKALRAYTKKDNRLAYLSLLPNLAVYFLSMGVAIHAAGQGPQRWCWPLPACASMCCNTIWATCRCSKPAARIPSGAMRCRPSPSPPTRR